MSNRVEQLLTAAKVPPSLASQRFGQWTIRRLAPGTVRLEAIGRELIWQACEETVTMLEQDAPDALGRRTVMDDSWRILRQHLAFWLVAHGRILVSGLGLGCFIRGLLTSPCIEHIDIIEIDPDILRVVGAEFAGNPRVALHHADALELAKTAPRSGQSWDFAWHDIHDHDPARLQELHYVLLHKFAPCVGRQGAWDFPRHWARALQHEIGPLVGAPRFANLSRSVEAAA